MNNVYLLERFFVSQKNAVNLTETGNGNTVQNIVGVVEQNLDNADKGGIEFVFAKHLSELAGRHKLNFILQAASERNGIEIGNRADAKWSERTFQIVLALAVGSAAFRFIAVNYALRLLARRHFQLRDFGIRIRHSRE